MFRNQYDNDNTTWSPQGRLLQVEYSCEAVKQGAVALGLRDDRFAVLLALKRSPGDLASYQKKILPVDSHVGMAIAGLTSDARVLNTFMRSESLNERMTFGRPLSIYRLATLVGDKAQVNTQQYGGRPYGVGLLLAGYDETGPHLYECSPTGHISEYYGMAIGARSQPARTYLERHMDDFAALSRRNTTDFSTSSSSSSSSSSSTVVPSSTSSTPFPLTGSHVESFSSLDDLVLHGLQALKESLSQDATLTSLNTAISVVGQNLPFRVLNETEIEGHLKRLIEVTGTAQGGRSTGVQSSSFSAGSVPSSTNASDEPTRDTGVTPPMGSMDVE